MLLEIYIRVLQILPPIFQNKKKRKEKESERGNETIEINELKERKIENARGR